jgi:hypothetical protein
MPGNQEQVPSSDAGGRSILQFGKSVKHFSTKKCHRLSLRGTPWHSLAPSKLPAGNSAENPCYNAAMQQPCCSRQHSAGFLPACRDGVADFQSACPGELDKMRLFETETDIHPCLFRTNARRKMRPVSFCTDRAGNVRSNSQSPAVGRVSGKSEIVKSANSPIFQDAQPRGTKYLRQPKIGECRFSLGPISASGCLRRTNREQFWRTVHSTYDKIGLAKQWRRRRNEAFQQHAPVERDYANACICTDHEANRPASAA